MIMIWSGFGFVVVAFAVIASMLCNAAVDAGLGAGYYDAHNWPVGLAMLVAGVLCAFCGHKLRQRTGRELVDAQTGERVVLRSSHTLFFIPVHIWAYVLGAIGVLLVASELLR